MKILPGVSGGPPVMVPGFQMKKSLELVGDSLNRPFDFAQEPLRAANFVLLCVKKPRRIYGYDCVFCLDQNKICSLSLNQENPNKLLPSDRLSNGWIGFISRLILII